MTLNEKAVKWLTLHDIDAYVETTPSASGNFGVYIRVGTDAVLEISTEEVEYRAELFNESEREREEA